MTTPCNSWIIEEIETGQPVMEAMNPQIPERLNTKKYRAWLAIDWLRELNRRINSENTNDGEGV